jgi:HEAT repeat protein
LDVVTADLKLSALSGLLELLDDPDDTVRGQATHSIVLLCRGLADTSVTHQAIGSCLYHPNPEVRRRTVQTLGEQWPQELANSSYLLDALHDVSPEVRVEASTALLSFPRLSSSAIPTLVLAIKDLNATVRQNAVLLLEKMGSVASPALQSLEEAQNDLDADVRYFAQRAVRSINESARR